MTIKNITKQTIEGILAQYETQYLLVDGKGCINYDSNYIAVNPIFNEDYKTLAFGVVAHYFNELGLELTENEVESHSKELLKNPEVMQYLKEYKIGTKYMNCSYEHIPSRVSGFNRDIEK